VLGRSVDVRHRRQPQVLQRTLWVAAQEPSPDFGGYSMFTRNGVPTAGGMGDMEDMPANNTWEIYLATDDIVKTVEAAETSGAQPLAPAMSLADLGLQTTLIDPWRPPWHLATRDLPGVYRAKRARRPELVRVAHATTRPLLPSVASFTAGTRGLWATATMFCYTTMRDPEGDGDLAGIMDAGAFLPEAMPAPWSIYWDVEDADATVAKVRALGGSVVLDAKDTPWGGWPRSWTRLAPSLSYPPPTGSHAAE